MTTARSTAPDRGEHLVIKTGMAELMPEIPVAASFSEVVVAADRASAVQPVLASVVDPVPDPVGLDVNLVRLTAPELIAPRTGNHASQRRPVAVLATTAAERLLGEHRLPPLTDLEDTHKLSADCCVTEPVDVIRFGQVVLPTNANRFGAVRLRR